MNGERNRRHERLHPDRNENACICHAEKWQRRSISSLAAREIATALTSLTMTCLPNLRNRHSCGSCCTTADENAIRHFFSLTLFSFAPLRETSVFRAGFSQDRRWFLLRFPEKAVPGDGRLQNGRRDRKILDAGDSPASFCRNPPGRDVASDKIVVGPRQ